MRCVEGIAGTAAGCRALLLMRSPAGSKRRMVDWSMPMNVLRAIEAMAWALTLLRKPGPVEYAIKHDGRDTCSTAWPRPRYHSFERQKPFAGLLTLELDVEATPRGIA